MQTCLEYVHQGGDCREAPQHTGEIMSLDLGSTSKCFEEAASRAISAQTAATVTQALISGIKWALTLLNLYSRALQNLKSYLKWCHMSWL